jgi:cytochrome bd-type quinol oxidase subunit 2
VTAASIVMSLLSLGSLAWAAVLAVSFLLIDNSRLESQLRRNQPDITGEQLDTMVAMTKGLGFAIAALVAVLGIALAGLAAFVYRGNRVARILALVTSSGYVFCGLCIAASAGISATSGVRSGTIAVVFPLVTLAAAISVIVLLALPRSGRYFARPVPPWQAAAGFGPATPAAAPPAADQPNPGGQPSPPA